MSWKDVRALRGRRYTWREIGRLMDVSGFTAWMLFGPLGWRAREETQ